jgi:4-amino-4-deoxy-L-arabinose transferase-like glycosyltransferase
LKAFPAFPSLGRPAAYALLIALWAAIFLPGLGSIEIKGEEIRRIMPGMNMLESGNWIVPHFNGYPYLRKPPLVNWAIALSVRSLRARNEWTVRLPSVLAMLAMGLVMLATCAPWLGTNAALAAVLIAFTSAGIVEKGRLAEIEAIYIALFGMAFSCWLGWTAMARSRWLVWPVTGLLLGVGLLAKGPPHLAFFYAIAAFIAWRSRGKKGTPGEVDTALASWAHLCGVLIMLGVFALWCVPYMRQAATLGAGGVWARQMEQRVGGGDTGTIFINFLRSLVNFLPWVLGLPLFWRRATLDRLSERDRLIVEAARWPIVICAFLLMFIPGMLPRYTLPLVIPYALLLALLLKAEMGDASLRWPLAAGCIAGVGMLAYGVFFAPRVAAHGYARDFAAQINAVMPAGSPIYIYNPSVQPQIFYIHGRIIYQDSVKTLPDEVPWLLTPEKDFKALQARFQQYQVLAQPRDQGGQQYAFVSLQGHAAPPPKRPKAKSVTAPPTGP